MPKKRLPDEGAADSDDMPALALQRRFGTNFKRARIDAGLTQSQVADLSKIPQTTISEIENGKNNLTLRQMHRIAVVVAHDVSVLLAPVQKTPKTK